MSVDTAVAEPAGLPATRHRLVVATALPTRGLLGRVAAVLSAHRVSSLSYRTPANGLATVEVSVPASDAARVQAKLLRMVDVLDARCVPELQQSR